jgi:hypothetical protein
MDLPVTPIMDTLKLSCKNVKVDLRQNLTIELEYYIVEWRG